MTGAVLFDCDGVLINSEQIAAAVLSMELGQKHDFGYKRDEYLELICGHDQHMGLKRVIEDFEERKGYALPDDFEEKLWVKIRKHNKRYLKALKGVEALFQSLQSAGIPFAICTNGDHEHVTKNLQQVGLYKYVEDCIFTREDVDNIKPAPDVYLYGAQKLGVDPKDCVFVEDSQSGTKAGRRAGMYGIGFIGEGHRHKLIEKFLLLAAGARKVAYNMDEVKDIIGARFNIDLSPPVAANQNDCGANAVSQNAKQLTVK